MAIKFPEKKNVPQFNFCKEKIILHGINKIGKTALCAEIPDSIFLATERGQSKTNAYILDINSWTEFQEAVRELKMQTRFKMIIMDNIDCLWILYRAFFLLQNGKNHEGDIPFKGWSMLVRGFSNEFVSLQSSGLGYVLIASTRNAAKEENKSFFEPNIYRDKENEVWNSVVGTADIVLYMTMEMLTNPTTKELELTRVIKTVGSDTYLAGSRWPMRATIPLINGDPAGSAARLMKAYELAQPNNKTEKEKETVK